MAADERFDGRIALVTGARGGIGSATVAALRERGAIVFAADVTAPPLRPDQDLSNGADLALDVTSRRAVHEAVGFIERGAGAIDLLVNVAGVVSFGSAASLEEAEWDRVLGINLKGSFLASQAVIPGMKRARFGRIVNLGSVVGKNAGNARPWLSPDEQARAGNVAYGVSKAGVHAMTAFLAKELAAFGVTVNAVAPGPIATAMTTNFPEALRALIPVGRMGTMNDVVRAILFLASKDAGFINGEVLDVNGGMWCD